MVPPHYETFTARNLKEIATAVAKPLAQVNSDIKASPTFNGTLPFVCRYNESAWNFLKRLSAATGQWLYFNGSGHIFGRAEAARAVELVYGQDCYELSLSMQAAPVQTGVFDYNASVDTVISEPAHIPKADAGAYAGAAFRQSRTLFSAPAHGTVPALGGEKSVAEVIGRSKAEGVSAGLYRMQGQSTIYYLRPGTLIDVEFKRRGEHAYHGQMRIVSISHHLEGSGHYYNKFEAIPASGGAPVLDYEQPSTHPMLAKVIDNKDPFGQGRIKSSFIGWTGENSSETDWLRVSSPDGGGTDAVGVNRGIVFVPEIGDQIFVQFLENNPDKPYVSGSAFHGSNSSGQSNMIRTIMTKSGNKVIMNDSEGSITVSDPSGNIWYMDGKGNINVTAPKNMNFNIGENFNISVGKDMITKVGENRTTTVELNDRLQANEAFENINENKTVKIVGDLKETTGTTTHKAKQGDIFFQSAGVAKILGAIDAKVNKG
jgi:uncharacterized protein involved in type VI secretion and phage assembly